MKTLFNNNLLNLIAGEINRAVKYKVLTIGAGVSFIWLAVIFFTRSNTAELSMIVPLLIFADVAMMSTMLIGASIFFEKQEGSIRSVIIAPVTIGQILISKLVNAIFIAIVSALIVSIGTIIMTDIKINVFALIIYVVVIAGSHSAIGFGISMVSKDFNSMLINYMMFVIVFMMPPILFMFNVIPDKYEMLLLISPSQAGNILISSTLSVADTDWYKIAISFIYLAAITYIAMRYFVYNKFLKDAVRG